jgi:MFS transporter, UMF1 family
LSLKPEGLILPDPDVDLKFPLPPPSRLWSNTAMSAPQQAGRKEIFGWAMFDFANQAYTLLIITVVFGDLFARIIVGDRGDDFRLGNLLWSISLSISYLMVVASGPVLGAIMDFTASKKRFLFHSYVLTVVATTCLYFVAPGWVWLGMVLIVISNYAYSVGESFIASFLPELGPPEKLGWISGFGWALGYVGGLVAAGFTLLFLGEVSEENFERIRWVGPFAGFFFMVAAIPTFLWLKERGSRQALPAGKSLVAMGFRTLHATLLELRHYRDMATLMVSVFFAMAGVYIVIAFAFIYGAQVIGWDHGIRNTMFIVVQITAATGAIVFGFIQDRIGARHLHIHPRTLDRFHRCHLLDTTSDRLDQCHFRCGMGGATPVPRRGLPCRAVVGFQSVRWSCPCRRTLAALKIR